MTVHKYKAMAAKVSTTLKTRVWPTLIWMGKTGIPTSSGILLSRLSDHVAERIPEDVRARGSNAVGWLERTMTIRKGAGLSMALHMVLVAFAYFGLPWFARDFDFVDIPISVEVVNVTDTTSAPPTQPKKKVEPVPEKKPEPQAKATDAPPPPPPRPSEEDVAIVPILDTKPKTKKKPEDTPEKKTTPDLSKVKPERKPERKPEKKQDFASVLKTLEELKVQPPPDKKDDTKKKTDQEKIFEDVIASALDQPQARGTSTEPLSISEIDLVRRQIAACWNLPAGAKEADDLIVEIKVAMNRDGTVNNARITDASRMGRDPFFRAAAESALRAVLNPKCSPLRLPPDKFDRWQTMSLNFNPKELLGP